MYGYKVISWFKSIYYVNQTDQKLNRVYIFVTTKHNPQHKPEFLNVDHR